MGTRSGCEAVAAPQPRPLLGARITCQNQPGLWDRRAGDGAGEGLQEECVPAQALELLPLPLSHASLLWAKKQLVFYLEFLT